MNTEAENSLREILGDRLVTGQAVREAHSRDESRHEPQLPDAVAFVESTEEVSKIVSVCAEHGVAVVPFGAGTGLEGGAVPRRGGVSLDFSNMNKILRVHEEDLDVTVQAGVTHRQLNRHLKTSGLFFPVDPGADATIGGMSATRASGTNAVRYGTMRENVLSLTVVLADGRIITTAQRARKSAAGYDLTRLFVGSEGTLGIITEITLRLYGIPEAMAAAVCGFDTLEGAVNTVIATIQAGIPVARIELLDDVQVDAVNKFSKLDFPIKNTLFIEFHGSDASVVEQAEFVQSLAADFGGENFVWKTKQEERAELWKARHDVGWACKALRPGSGCEFFSTDVCVPISKLAECILETKADLEESFLIAPIVGHVGDGNFHLTILVNPDEEKELEEANRINSRLVERALRFEGTCTGEHGVGIGKRSYLRGELGDGVEVIAAIKNTLDPQNIFNPGKILPDELISTTEKLVANS